MEPGVCRSVDSHTRTLQRGNSGKKKYILLKLAYLLCSVVFLFICLFIFTINLIQIRISLENLNWKIVSIILPPRHVYRVIFLVKDRWGKVQSTVNCVSGDPLLYKWLNQAETRQWTAFFCGFCFNFSFQVSTLHICLGIT